MNDGFVRIFRLLGASFVTFLVGTRKVRHLLVVYLLVNKKHVHQRRGHPDERHPIKNQIRISVFRNILQGDFHRRVGKNDTQNQNDLQKTHCENARHKSRSGAGKRNVKKSLV
jgi:hypothetical protein